MPTEYSTFQDVVDWIQNRSYVSSVVQEDNGSDVVLEVKFNYLIEREDKQDIIRGIELYNPDIDFESRGKMVVTMSREYFQD